MPLSFVIAFVMSNPLVEDISIFPEKEFVTGALTFILFPVFFIFIPAVAKTDAVSEIVKLPFLFSISIVPSEVLISDAILEEVLFVVILILPFVLVISPMIILEPFALEIIVLPSAFITSPDWE